MLNCKKHPSKILALFSLIILLPVVFSLVLLVMVEAVHAATLTVNTAVDENDGECVTDCSLRDAIALAANGDTITFSGNYTIYLNSQLDMHKTLTIDGSGHTVTVSGDSGGDGTRDVRVFYIDSNGVVTMTHLNIVSGTTTGYGGGIYNDDGALTLSDSVISGNFADQGGGGLYNSGSSPTLTNVTFMANWSAYGGGMYNNSSSPTLTDLTFRANSASHGGGMYNSGSSPTLTNTTFISNSGGGMYNNNSSPTLTNTTFISNFGSGMYNNNSSSPTLTDVTFSGNSADYGAGMYNLNNSSPTLTNVTFSDNWLSGASGSGGGMYNNNSNPALTNVTFSDNQAPKGGGMFNYQNSPRLITVTFSGNSASSGGGMANQDSDPILTNVTFSDNSATTYGGGMYSTSNSNLTLTNVTFISNTATATGSGGGGMYTQESSAKLTNVTFSGNSAYYGGGMYNHYSNPALTNVTFSGNSASSGGGMYNLDYCSPQVRNSIFWGDAGTGEIYNQLSTSTPVISDSVVQGGCPSGVTCTNVITTTPQLGALGYYGGGTPTLPLLAGSSALDTGNDAVCPATDQRGVARPQGAHCDIGAFEASAEIAVLGNNTEIADGDTTPSTADHTDFGGGPLGQALTRTFTISNSGGMTLTLTGSPVVSLTGAGADNFSVVVQPATTSISPNITTTFQVRFSPPVTGTRVATVTIANNDSDENPYDFAIQGAGLAPEIAVLGNGQVIADGDTTPSANDHTDFGNVALNQALTRTFTISDSGTAALNLTGTPAVSLTGAGAGSFSVVVQPATTSISSNITTTFQVRFTPSVTGTRVATVTIANNDSDENPYDFAIQGAGTVTPGYTSSPAISSTINVGNAVISAPVTATLTISETGNTTLNITSHSLSGANASDFTVTPATLAIPNGGAAQTLYIRCVPGAGGLRVAALTVNHNAPGSPATYTLNCTGAVAAYLPIILKNVGP